MSIIRCKKLELIYLNKRINVAEDFFIDTNNTSIKTKIDSIKNLKLIKRNELIERKQFIYGEDENNKPFTLFDCYVLALNYNYNELEIVWNKMLYGIKTEFLDDLLIDQMDLIYDNNNSNYRALVGKNTFYIDDHKMLVNSNWYIEQEGTRKIVRGNVLSFNSTTQEKFLNYISNAKMLIDIYYFMVGFFPDYYKFILYYNGNKIYYYQPNDGIQTSKEVYARYINCIVETDKVDYEKAFEIWKNMYNNQKHLFHMFMGIQQKENNQFVEVNTFNYIQCLESFYTSYYPEYYKFQNEYKMKLINNIKFIFLKNQKLKRRMKKDIRKINKLSNSNYSFDELCNSINGKFNSINEISLNQLLNNIFKLPISMSIFEYEYNNKLIKLFKTKTYNHRNYIAHMTNEKMITFYNRENMLAQSKFNLLFRCMVLNQLDIEIDNNNIILLLNEINKYYDNNTLTK